MVSQGVLLIYGLATIYRLLRGSQWGAHANQLCLWWLAVAGIAVYRRLVMQRMQRTLRARTLREGDWEILIGRIKEGKCTPFLGAGACADVLPLASDIANEWADRYKYPLPDHKNLIQVAQFLTVEYGDSEFAKRLVKQRIETVTPNF